MQGEIRFICMWITSWDLTETYAVMFHIHLHSFAQEKVDGYQAAENEANYVLFQRIFITCTLEKIFSMIRCWTIAVIKRTVYYKIFDGNMRGIHQFQMRCHLHENESSSNSHQNGTAFTSSFLLQDYRYHLLLLAVQGHRVSSIIPCAVETQV